MEKQKKKSFKNLSEEILLLYNEQYHGGFVQNDIRVIELGSSKKLYTILIEAEDVNYLVKVDVNIDSSNILSEKKEIVHIPDVERNIIEINKSFIDEKSFISEEEDVFFNQTLVFRI